MGKTASLDPLLLVSASFCSPFKWICISVFVIIVLNFCYSSIRISLTLSWRSRSQTITGLSINGRLCLYSVCLRLVKRKENTENGSAEQVRLPSRIFIMSCQSFLSAQQLSSALIPPNLPHLSLLSLFCDTLLRRPVSFITSGGIEFLQLSI